MQKDLIRFLSFSEGTLNGAPIIFNFGGERSTFEYLLLGTYTRIVSAKGACRNIYICKCYLHFVLKNPQSLSNGYKKSAANCACVPNLFIPLVSSLPSIAQYVGNVGM